ncbi:hypothetical protein PMZ80_007787 [Knufia obscura]|uniref:Uncharacterized protein n=2 Tax=Knufia TaxID=430999 RepID=A0AAN8INM1_9EURO|nr:hypothetical protein PMZ80_007787 [Knufia obscura]KAK5954322.1 hypothetical protein OHC33_004895 [Knufia fluminis]
MSTGRICDGPRPVQAIIFQHEQPHRTKSKSPSPNNSITPQAWLNFSSERRAFSFFLQRVVPALSGALDSGLWSVLVPRIAASSAVVRYTIFAIAHFWEHPVRRIEDGQIDICPLSQKHLAALTWQSKALSTDLAQTGQADTSDVLLKCVLFASLEFQQNNFRAGLRLIRTAFAMLAPYLTAGCSGMQASLSDEIVCTLLPVLMRSSCVIFTSWEDVCTGLPSTTSIEDLQAAVFRGLRTVYAGLKDVYLARRSNLHDQIDRLHMKQAQTKYTLQSLKDCLSGIMEIKAESPHSAARALHDYCSIGLSWVDFLTNISESACNNSVDFLSLILQHTRRIESDANTLYPHAVSTTFFRDMTIRPLAYLVAVFAPNVQLRTKALAMLGHTKASPNAQLHAIVMSLEGGIIDAAHPSFKNMYQVDYGPTQQPQVLHKVYDIPMLSSEPAWQHPEPLYAEPV